jgi:hypothetical protein
MWHVMVLACGQHDYTNALSPSRAFVMQLVVQGTLSPLVAPGATVTVSAAVVV